MKLAALLILAACATTRAGLGRTVACDVFACVDACVDDFCKRACVKDGQARCQSLGLGQCSPDIEDVFALGETYASQCGGGQ